MLYIASPKKKRKRNEEEEENSDGMGKLLKMKKSSFIPYLVYCENVFLHKRIEFHFKWKRKAKRFDLKFHQFISTVFAVMIGSWFKLWMVFY